MIHRVLEVLCRDERAIGVQVPQSLRHRPLQMTLDTGPVGLEDSLLGTRDARRCACRENALGAIGSSWLDLSPTG
jgi:hypothetical protein